MWLLDTALNYSATVVSSSELSPAEVTGDDQAGGCSTM